MPPIPPLLPRPVQVQMDALRKQYHELDSLITRLSTLSGSPLSVQQDLSRQAREEARAIELKIEDLKLLAEEQDRESDRNMILVMLERIETQFKQQQYALRQAILTSKQTIDKEAKSERELLLGGSKSASELSELRRRGASGGKGPTAEYLLNTSKEHNESLSRTLKLMQQEVERTAHSAKVIDDSSRMLRSTVNEYQTYGEVLKRGKHLITKLSQADWTDRLLIGFGLLVFTLVVLYILKKRIADRGISLIGYLLMPARWFFALLMPSLRAPPPMSPLSSVEVTATVARDTLKSATVSTATIVTSVAEKILENTRPTKGLLDVLVGE
ncbi:hypothetical protein BGW42_008053 [Actinomortierella wolfii]|nr:hypothetical protein BGW42_008053 [Actinomortierella wolfii]